MLKEMVAEANAIPTGTVKLRLALARRPLEPARTEVRLVEVGLVCRT